MPRERIEPDVLDWYSVLVGHVELAASSGLTDLDPVGGLVTGAAVALSLDEGLKKDGAIAVALLPVVRELSGEEGEDFGGEALGLDPGEHEEAGVVDDEL